VHPQAAAVRCCGDASREWLEVNSQQTDGTEYSERLSSRIGCGPALTHVPRVAQRVSVTSQWSR
jgi:hypothetical protein